MARCLLGLETEYAAACIGRDGRCIDSDDEPVLWDFFHFAASRLTCLQEPESASIFLANGARFYIDSGDHPEMTTPECTDPRDVARYVLAGDRLLVKEIQAFVDRRPDIKELWFARSNVDYVNRFATWACHESYLYKGSTSVLPDAMIPFLASRIIFTGAGGFDPTVNKLEFTLSPRVAHLETSVSTTSTEERGIFNLRDEPLCGNGYHRVHLICGESNCSQLSTVLKMGTTALVLKLIEHGYLPGRTARLAAPVDAMRVFAKDESCLATVRGAPGHRIKAVDVQRCYLDLAETHQRAGFMPEWAPVVIRYWRDVLDRIECGAPESVAKMLDWAIKRDLYRSHIRRRAANLGVSSDPSVLSSELFEIDARYSQLGDKGIFASMDRAGVLDHHVPGVDRIEQATCEPPEEGRARIRGRWIRELAGNGQLNRCNWDHVLDGAKNRWLDLSDPFEEREKWWKITRTNETRAASDQPSRRTRHNQQTDDSMPIATDAYLYEHRARLRAATGRFIGRRRRSPGSSASQPASEPVPMPEPRSGPEPTSDGFCVGDRVIVRRPANPEGLPRDEWVPAMNACDGQAAVIVGLIDRDEPGRSLVTIAAGRRWTTRTCHLQRQ